MNIQKIKLEQLLPAEYNPRKDLKQGDKEYEKLKKSIETYGYTVPIVWNKSTGNVVGGHQRLTVLKDIGYTEADCVVVDLDETNEKALNIALNKIQGEWDEDKLSELISELSGTDIDVGLTGFEAVDIETMIRGARLGKLKEDNFDINGELTQPAVCRLGDIWMLGRHCLVCGGSTQHTLDRLMDGRKANLLIAAVPLGAAADEIQRTLSNSAAVLADGASVYLFHEDADSMKCRQAYANVGFYLSATCVWERPAKKTATKNADYMTEHSLVLFGWKKGNKGRNLWYADRSQTTIWDIPAENEMEYPVALMGYPILNSSMTNGIILAPFGGYGSVLLACEQTNRVCLMAEQHEKNCDVVIKRYINQSGGASSVFVIRNGETLSYTEVNG